MLTAYREAGGRDAIVLFHDDEHGAELIDALARDWRASSTASTASDR